MTSFMDHALNKAREAARQGEVPVGCVIVRDGAVVAEAGNRKSEVSHRAAAFARLRSHLLATND